MQAELKKSYSSAVDTASRHPQYQDQIVAAAKSSFLSGDDWAYLAATLIFFMVPKKDQEVALLARYAEQDAEGDGLAVVGDAPPARV